MTARQSPEALADAWVRRHPSIFSGADGYGKLAFMAGLQLGYRTGWYDRDKAARRRQRKQVRS